MSLLINTDISLDSGNSLQTNALKLPTDEYETAYGFGSDKQAIRLAGGYVTYWDGAIDITSTVSPGSNLTITYGTVYRIGHAIYVAIMLKSSAAIAVKSVILTGLPAAKQTIPLSGKTNLVYRGVSNGTNGDLVFYQDVEDNNLKLSGAPANTGGLTQNKYLYLEFSYIAE